MKPRGIIVLSLGVLLLIAVFGVVGIVGDESEYLSDEEFIVKLRANEETGEVSGGDPGRAPAVEGKGNLAAKIELESDFYDFGLIDSDAVAHGQLKVYNRGKVPLKISGVKTQCPCTMGSLPDEIEPGGEAIMEITVDPSLILGFQSQKILTIRSNDPVNRYARVAVQARVEPEVAVEPGIVDFGIVEVGGTPERLVRVRQLAEDDFTISFIEIKGPDDNPFILDHREVPEENWARPGKREYDVSVAVSPAAGPGDHSVLLAVHTNSYARLKYFSIRVEMTAK